jgi:hypothetical protein
MKDIRVSIEQMSESGLQVLYDSGLSASAQISIRWKGQHGGVGMSIEQARELQQLLDQVLQHRFFPPENH